MMATSIAQNAREHVSATILAAGQARRLGGRDKGLLPLGTSTMAGVLLARIAPQVATVAINAVANHAEYARMGCSEVFADDAVYGSSAGPLAGMASALARVRTPWLLTLACDTPLIPHDLAARMLAVAVQQGVQAVTAAGFEFSLATMTAAAVRTQPTIALLHRSLWAHLDDFVRSGGRKIDAWTAQVPHAIANFDREGDAPHAWANANTPEELAALQELYAQETTSA